MANSVFVDTYTGIPDLFPGEPPQHLNDGCIYTSFVLYKQYYIIIFLQRGLQKLQQQLKHNNVCNTWLRISLKVWSDKHTPDRLATEILGQRSGLEKQLTALFKHTFSLKPATFTSMTQTFSIHI